MTTASDRDAASAEAGRGSGAMIFLVAMGVAFAMTGGAILTAAGNGALQEVVRVMTSPAPAATLAERLQQTANVARLEHDVRTLIDEISDLKAQRNEVNRDPAVEDRLVKLDASLAQLSAKTAQLSTATTDLRSETAQLRARTNELSAAQSAIQAVGDWREQVDELKASLAQAGIGMDAMRSSIDASDRSHAKEIADIGRRVDRLERMTASEATGSTAAAPRRRGNPRRPVEWHLAGWSVQGGQNGAAIITGETGTYEVTSGTFVPGIGRISRIQQRANRWVVETEKGTIIQR
ncbi:MAG TPA: hypothetical protein VK281_16195 [Xanthobacteraceae bacterium]|nr:hypothetical protein [Xanthobacteraceae bacterium]